MSRLAVPLPRAIDGVAVALWLSLALLLAAAGTGDRPHAGRVVGLVIGAGLVYVAGRVAGRHNAAPLLLAVASAAVAVVLLVPDIRSGGATARPLGYGNANGAFLAVGAVAATASVLVTRDALRWAAAGAVTILLVALLTTQSVAATALAFLAVGSTLALLRFPQRGRLVATVAGGGLVAVIATTVALGAAYDGPGAATATEALSSRRVALWSDAVDLTEQHPGSGVGLGRFPSESATARAEPDTRFAHSLPLELSAEAGMAAGGVAALLGIVLVLAAMRSRDPAWAVVGSWAVVVFAAQASIDYTARYPAVVLPAALVAGLTSARRGG